MQIDYKITEAEQEVMEVLWECQGPVRTRELFDIMVSHGRKWKRQTLNTFLYRLESKKIVKRRRAYVEAVLSKEELLQRQTQQMLDTFYDGEYLNFIAALTKNEQIDSETKAKLEGLVGRLKESARVS